MADDKETRDRQKKKKKAREIITYAIQKFAVDHVSKLRFRGFTTNDEMKGRIIGREGNIRALETLTGIDLIIDDTPKPLFSPGLIPFAGRLHG